MLVVAWRPVERVANRPADRLALERLEGRQWWRGVRVNPRARSDRDEFRRGRGRAWGRVRRIRQRHWAEVAVEKLFDVAHHRRMLEGRPAMARADDRVEDGVARSGGPVHQVALLERDRHILRAMEDQE